MPHSDTSALWGKGDRVLHDVTGTSSSISEKVLNDRNELAVSGLYANIEGSLTHSKNSAFSRHSVKSKSLKSSGTNRHNSDLHNQRNGRFAYQRKVSDLVSREPSQLSKIIWRNPRFADVECDLMRPRTWSEDCFLHKTKALDSWKFEDLVKNNSLQENLVSCGVVERICSSFNQFIKDGLCFNQSLIPDKLDTESRSILRQSRRRHFSDDPSLVSSAKTLISSTEATERGQTTVNNNATLVTCHGAARTGARARSQFCPF